jgi:CRP-like cAMP-binding protein
MTQPARPFLEAIGERAAAALRGVGVTRRWPDGSVIFHEGDRADRVLVIETGRVKFVATEANGTETVLAVRGPGDLVGEVSAVDDGPRSATAIALGGVTCLAVGIAAFRTVVADHRPASDALLRTLAARLREAEGRRAEYAALDTVQRLARRLLELAGDGTTVERLTHEDLAALIGASRESVAKALQVLRGAGLVRTGRREIEILDPDVLAARSR